MSGCRMGTVELQAPANPEPEPVPEPAPEPMLMIGHTPKIEGPETDMPF